MWQSWNRLRYSLDIDERIGTAVRLQLCVCKSITTPLHNLICPFVLLEQLSGYTYLRFLRGQMPALLEDIPVAVCRDMWYRHDGAPSGSLFETSSRPVSRIWVSQSLDWTLVIRHLWHVHHGPPTSTSCIIVCVEHRTALAYRDAVLDVNTHRQRIVDRCNDIRTHVYVSQTALFPPQTSQSFHCYKCFSYRTLPLRGTVMCTTTTTYLMC